MYTNKDWTFGIPERRQRKKKKVEMGKTDRPVQIIIRMILCAYGNDAMFIIAPKKFDKTTSISYVYNLFY